MPCVVAYSVAFCHHTFYQIRAGFQIITNQKESGRGMMLFQGIEDGFCVPIFISGIKGEVEDGLGGIGNVMGLELF